MSVSTEVPHDFSRCGQRLDGWVTRRVDNFVCRAGYSYERFVSVQDGDSPNVPGKTSRMQAKVILEMR